MHDYHIAGTDANATAEKVESRDKVNAHKRWRSGVPSAHTFATSIRFEGGENGPEVLHFVVSQSAEDFSLGDNWNTIGMRGTGSHDVFLKDVFVPDVSIAARRPADQWHKIWSVVLPTALPLIMPAYVSIADTRRSGQDEGRQLYFLEALETLHPLPERKQVVLAGRHAMESNPMTDESAS